MAVRYKFRSSVIFDSVDIDGRPSISIRDLKSKIIQSKKLNVCQDLDLIVTDALTGQEYMDEKFQISSGSSVIIKRVPVRSVPSNKAYNSSFADFGVNVNNEVKISSPMNMEISFDDFGIDLCPVPESIFSFSDIDVDKNVYTSDERKNVDETRCFEPPTVGCQKFEASDRNEAIPRGPAHSGNKENNMLETKSKPDVQRCIKMGNVISANPPDKQNANFPSELKCSICKTLFKEAVMIPCCQHSFCERCIHSLLLEKARCPKCFSSKCKAEDLIPNVSLRGAIEHLLESQIRFDRSENALDRYAPDGESGIQANGMHCAVTNFQKEPELLDSPSATGRGSNQIVADKCGIKYLKSCSFPPKVKVTDGEIPVSAHPVNFKSRAADLEDSADSENQPIHEEAEYIIKKKRGLWFNTPDKNFMEIGRRKKGDRTCYVCGSPDHFIRDCPASLNSNPMFQRGSAMFPGAMPGKVLPYWNVPRFPHMRPLANIYGNPGMMPFNATMVPVAPYAVPTYMPVPPMFGSLPAYNGFMRMKSAAGPVDISMKRHLSFLRTSDFQDWEKKRNLENENMRSEQFSNDVNKRCHFGEAERLHDLQSHTSRESSVSYSEDNGYTYRSHRKHYHDSKLEDEMYSVDEKHEKGYCSSSWHGDDRQKKHCRNSKKHNERMDFSWNRYPTNKETDVERKRVKSDVRKHSVKHNSHSEPGLEPSYSSDKKKRHGPSRHKSKYIDDELNHDRWLMVGGSNEVHREDFRSYKRKKVY
ncbi:hypothetical protein LWI29_011872 [Acer saccharum]|uniref:Uncharacterized protein n=1 Tax=Acer saccharum TaxID=4024 RepID=A0AA39RCE2_ACESA|nr:hypothetical protein LWI29_011872 [Acer saccharum]